MGEQTMRFAVKAIVFDLDGVLCFTDEYHFAAWKQVAERHGIYFDRRINDRLRGIGRMESLEILLERAQRRYTPKEKQALAEEKNGIYRRSLERLTDADLPDGVRSTLKALRERGYRLAVGSSSKNAKLILDRLGIAALFDAVADGTDVTRSKPDPQVFLAAARKLGVPPGDCAVVEDAAAGVAAAKAAGMSALALFGDARGCGAEDYDLASFADLLNIL